MAKKRATGAFLGTMILPMFSSGVFAGWVAPANNQVCDVKADFALGREDYAAAIKLHQEIVRSNPRDSLAHYHLGFAHAMIGRSEEELHEYLTSVRLGLSNWDLSLNLGLAYICSSKNSPRLSRSQQSCRIAGTGACRTLLQFGVRLRVQRKVDQRAPPDYKGA